jgi:hypothetical protein
MKVETRNVKPGALAARCVPRVPSDLTLTRNLNLLQQEIKITSKIKIKRGAK